MTKSQKAQLIQKFRQAASNIINGVDQFNSALTEYASVDAGNQLTDEDFTGESEGMTKQELVDAVSALKTLLDNIKDQGKNPGLTTVIYKIKL